MPARWHWSMGAHTMPRHLEKAGGGEKVRRGTRGPLWNYKPNDTVFLGSNGRGIKQKYAESSPKFTIRNLTRIVTIESFTKRQAEEGAAHRSSAVVMVRFVTRMAGLSVGPDAVVGADLKKKKYR